MTQLGQVGIVGGGMMGLVTALRLARSGRAQVTLFEREGEAGGLSRPLEIIPGVRWDRFYHVILSTDQPLLDLLAEVGLAPDVNFRTTRTGFYTDGALHSLSTTLEFLRFKPLSLLDKLRLGLGILYSSRLADASRLEKKLVQTWLVQVFGRRTYEKLWLPLLRAKLGTANQQVSAAFIWATINRYYGTRRKGAAKQEQMGYVRGGYHTILGALRRQLEQAGGVVRLGAPVQRLEQAPGGKVALQAGDERLEFDRVVATVPNPELVRLWPQMPEIYRDKLEAVQYLGLVCLALVLRRSLSPYYVTNLTDPGFPFTGVIEASALVDPQELGGHHLVYLPRYLAPGEAFLEAPDATVTSEFLAGLRRVHPDLQDEDILGASVQRERLVQPLQVVDYSSIVPPLHTPMPNLHLVNTTMILDSTLNNNQVVQLATRMADSLLSPG